MSLLNVENPLPQYMIVVVRYLAHVGKPVSSDLAKAMLCPPVLGDEKAYESSLSTLKSLGLIREDRNHLGLTVTPSDAPASIIDVLRTAVLAEEHNTGVGESESQSGPRDLIRALCWFLTLDPVADVLNLSEVQLRQREAIHAHLGDPIVNDTRWNRFRSWSSALGFCTPALTADPEKAGGARLMPDCTNAVRRTVQGRWATGDSLKPNTALQELRKALPVLPGGLYSVAVGLASPGPNHAGPALSFALLRGHDEKWLRLDQDDDARHLLHLDDPDQPDFPRTFSSITVLEATRG